MTLPPSVREWLRSDGIIGAVLLAILILFIVRDCTGEDPVSVVPGTITVYDPTPTVRLSGEQTDKTTAMLRTIDSLKAELRRRKVRREWVTDTVVIASDGVADSVVITCDETNTATSLVVRHGERIVEVPSSERRLWAPYIDLAAVRTVAAWSGEAAIGVRLDPSARVRLYGELRMSADLSPRLYLGTRIEF